MEKSIRFLGICILISSILICSTFWAINFFVKNYKYDFKVDSNNLVILDKTTGKYYFYNGIPNEIDPVGKYRK